MAKVKGGLGESSLIEDLTKPISFHISESLEPPPPFNRRKTAQKDELMGVQDSAKEERPEKIPGDEAKPLAMLILEKTSAMMEGGDIQIVFHLEKSSDSLLLENASHSPGLNWRITSVRGKEGGYGKIDWSNSIFSRFKEIDVIDRYVAEISLVEVISDENFINFSSMADFFEWLEIDQVFFIKKVFA